MVGDPAEQGVARADEPDPPRLRLFPTLHHRGFRPQAIGNGAQYGCVKLGRPVACRG